MSLDAPVVAVLWQALFARAMHTSIRPAEFAALGLSVWFIYLSDRLLDALRDGGSGAPRRQFYYEHWRALSATAGGALFALGWSCACLNLLVLRNGITMLAAVALYFAIVHVAPSRLRRLWPKELAVGVIFAAGCSLTTWTQMTGPRYEMLAPALEFAALCWLNCVAIEYWEWRRLTPTAEPPHALTQWMGPRLPAATFLLCLAIVCLLPWPVESVRLLLAAGLVSGASLLWLARKSERIPSDVLRVLADVSLFSPLLVLLLRIAP